MWVSAEMYSAPSIVLQSRRHDGGMHVFDDFREAYAWLRHNTDPSAKVRCTLNPKFLIISMVVLRVAAAEHRPQRQGATSDS